jgi:hypothetical protein
LDPLSHGVGRGGKGWDLEGGKERKGGGEIMDEGGGSKERKDRRVGKGKREESG